MKRIITITVVALSVLAAGCYSPPPPGSQPGPQADYTVAPPQAPDKHSMVYAPSPPPLARVEMIPTPPNGQVDAFYWVPGNWKWHGTADGHSGWQWTAGHYVARPSHTATYQPGHWQESNAGYLWIDGYWR